MSPRTTAFPITEGIGIFVGVLAWDLLVDGQLELLKALVISTSCTLVWYGMRCWNNKENNKKP